MSNGSRAAPRSAASSPSRLISFDADLGGRDGLRPFEHLAAYGIDHQVAGLHQAASEHDHLRVEHADEVGDTHAKPARCFFDYIERGSVAAAGGFDHRLRVGRSGAARDGGSGRFAFEAPDLLVILLLAGIEDEPADRSRDVAGAPADLSAGDDARSDSGPHGQKDYIGKAMGHAAPLFAEHGRGPVAIDADRHRQGIFERLPERNLVPAPEVRCPAISAGGGVDPGYAQAHAGDGIRADCAFLFEALEHRADLRDRFPEALFGDGLLEAVADGAGGIGEGSGNFGSAEIETREERSDIAD